MTPLNDRGKFLVSLYMLTFIGMFLLSGCSGVLTKVAGGLISSWTAELIMQTKTTVDVASLITTQKTSTDHIASAVTDKDCSTFHFLEDSNTKKAGLQPSKFCQNKTSLWTPDVNKAQYLKEAPTPVDLPTTYINFNTQLDTTSTSWVDSAKQTQMRYLRIDKGYNIVALTRPSR